MLTAATLRLAENLPIERAGGIGEIMRVDYTTFGVEPPENSKSGRAGQPGTATGSPSSNAAESVPSSLDEASFSFDQTRVQSLQAQVLAQPDIREAKVQALQQAIGNDEYSVPPSQIADAIVNELAAGT